MHDAVASGYANFGHIPQTPSNTQNTIHVSSFSFFHQRGYCSCMSIASQIMGTLKSIALLALLSIQAIAAPHTVTSVLTVIPVPIQTYYPFPNGSFNGTHGKPTGHSSNYSLSLTFSHPTIRRTKTVHLPHPTQPNAALREDLAMAVASTTNSTAPSPTDPPEETPDTTIIYLINPSSSYTVPTLPWMPEEDDG